MTRREALDYLAARHADAVQFARGGDWRKIHNEYRAALDALTSPAAPSAEANVVDTITDASNITHELKMCPTCGCWWIGGYAPPPTPAASFEEALDEYRGVLTGRAYRKDIDAARQRVVDEYKRVEQDVNTWTDRFNHAMRLVAKAEADAARLRAVVEAAKNYAAENAPMSGDLLAYECQECGERWDADDFERHTADCLWRALDAALRAVEESK